MSTSITFTPPGCTLFARGFTRSPDRACIVCDTCGATRTVDELRNMVGDYNRIRRVTNLTATCAACAGVSSAVAVEQPVPEPAYKPQFNKPSAEREPAVCRWCKGAREITINFKTKPCDCVKGETVRDGSAMAHLVNSGDIGRGWKVKHKFRGLV